MTGFVRQRPIVSGVIAVILLLLIFSAFPIVPETKQAVIVRFGKPERILNRFNAGKPIGAVGAGVTYRVPGGAEVVWMVKRVQGVVNEPQPVLLPDPAGAV